MKTILLVGGMIAVAFAGTALGQSAAPSVINAIQARSLAASPR